MMSIQPSDSESNLSGFVRLNPSDKHFKRLYMSIIEQMESVNQDLVQIEKNLKNIVMQSGPLESQVSALLHSLPKTIITKPTAMDS